MRKISYFIAAFCLLPLPTLANDTAFGGNGATPMPVEQTDVSMLSENIVINGHEISREDMKGKWEYNCDYTFKNISNKPLSFQMGFPFPVNDELGETTVPEGYQRQKNSPLVYDFKLTVNGKPVPAKLTKITPLPDTDYKEAYLWPMTMTPNEIVKINHHYITGITFNVAGQHWVSFVLKTGALWKGGIIDSAHFEVAPNTPTRTCTEIDEKADYLKIKPSGMKVVGEGKNRKYVWMLKQFHPSEDLELCLLTGKNYVRYYIIYPILNKTGYNNIQIDLSNLPAVELQRLRNTIYAQYGKQFDNPELQDYFNKQWWYEPNPSYSESMLTEDDRKAVSAIMEHEKQERSELFRTQWTLNTWRINNA